MNSACAKSWELFFESHSIAPWYCAPFTARCSPDGTYLCLEINCSDKPQQNQGPIGALLQSCSVLLCLTLSLADNGDGLGTLGLHEPKRRELANDAGFSSVRRVPMDNPFNSLYELTP
jgi:hypothetical protein